ncbi:MAG: YDG domain-containing protein, partial [Patescibacteria group bacterium]
VGTINTTTGNVNPRPITVTAVTDTKIYNGTTDSDGTPVITSTFSPPVALVDEANFIQTYENKNVGTLKTLTPSGSVDDGNVGANYTVTFVNDATGVITEKTINVTAQPDTKTYDGTTSSDENPVVDPLETGDTVGTSPTQAYDTKDVATGKTLTPSGLIINDGNGGLNYNVVNVNNTTGVITAKNLTVAGATMDSKVYDGGVVATVNFTFAGLVGVIGAEDVTLDSVG